MPDREAYARRQSERLRQRLVNPRTQSFPALEVSSHGAWQTC